MATKKKTTVKKKATPKKVEPKVEETIEVKVFKCMECGTEFEAPQRPCPKCHGSVLRSRKTTKVVNT